MIDTIYGDPMKLTTLSKFALASTLILTSCGKIDKETSPNKVVVKCNNKNIKLEKEEDCKKAGEFITIKNNLLDEKYSFYKVTTKKGDNFLYPLLTTYP